jgi:hypothetical protein
MLGSIIYFIVPSFEAIQPEFLIASFNELQMNRVIKLLNNFLLISCSQYFVCIRQETE